MRSDKGNCSAHRPEELWLRQDRKEYPEVISGSSIHDTNPVPCGEIGPEP